MSEIDEEAGWSEFKQATLGLICKHRGCEPERWWIRYGVKHYEGPCKWCGAVQREEG